MSLEDDIMLRDENNVPSISDLIRDCQYESNNFHLAQLMDNCDWLCNTSPLSPNCSGDEIKRIKEEGCDEDSNDSRISTQEQPPVSLFKEAKRRQRPWSKSFVTSNYPLYYGIACVNCTMPKNLYMYTCIYVCSRRKDIAHDSSRRSVFVAKDQ